MSEKLKLLKNMDVSEENLKKPMPKPPIIKETVAPLLDRIEEQENRELLMQIKTQLNQLESKMDKLNESSSSKEELLKIQLQNEKDKNTLMGLWNQLLSKQLKSEK